MISHQARINARRIWLDDLITPTTGAAIKLACDFGLFMVILIALVLMADGYLRLASGDLQTVHAQAEALRGW